MLQVIEYKDDCGDNRSLQSRLNAQGQLDSDHDIHVAFISLRPYHKFVILAI